MMDFLLKMMEVCIENDGFYTENDKVCIENDGFLLKMMNYLKAGSISIMDSQHTPESSPFA